MEICCGIGCERCDYIGYFRESRRDLEIEIADVSRRYWRSGAEWDEDRLTDLYHEYERRYGDEVTEALSYNLANERWG